MQYDVECGRLLYHFHTIHPTLRHILLEKAYATIYHLFGNTQSSQLPLNPCVQGMRSRRSIYYHIQFVIGHIGLATALHCRINILYAQEQ